MSVNKIFNGYWLGYQPGGNTLGEVPECVNTVTLFVAAPGDDNTVHTGYLCKAYSKADQIAWVKQLQARGTRVLMSLMDTSNTHWNKIDIPTFVQNFKAEVIDGEWGLNGVDIDLESGMDSGVWADTFIALIQEFRKILGPKGSANANISVAAYRPYLEDPILETVGADLDWLNTMAYGYDYNGTKELYDNYIKYVDKVNLGIGCGYQNGQTTPMQTVVDLSKMAAITPKAGMVEFGLNNDFDKFTKKSQWAWVNAIDFNMNGVLVS